MVKLFKYHIWGEFYENIEKSFIGNWYFSIIIGNHCRNCIYDYHGTYTHS